MGIRTSKSSKRPPGDGASSADDIPKPYNRESYSSYLDNSLKKDNATAIVKCLSECSLEQRIQLSEDLPDYIQRCRAQLTPLNAYIVQLLLKPCVGTISHELKIALDSTNLQHTVEILFGVGKNVDLKTLLTRYDGINGVNALESSLKQACSPLLFQLLHGMCLRACDVENVEESSLDQVSSNLVSAAQNHSLFTDEQILISTCTSHTQQQMAIILDQFLKKCQRDMSVEIQKSDLDDSDKQNFTILVDILLNPSLYLVNSIHTCLGNVNAESERWLLFLLAVQNPDDMKDLKQVYRNTHFDALSTDIREKVEDDHIKHVLLKLVK